MSPGNSDFGWAAGGPEDEQADSGKCFFRLLRYSHIFAAAVREILEVKFLQEVCPDSLTPSQFHLLQLICENGVHQVGQVADFLGVSPPAATKNIDKLERLGLVVRTPSKGDRRATLLASSPKGRQVVREYEDLKASRLTLILDRFRQEEVAQLANLLERFSVSLLELEDSGKGLCLRCAAHWEEHCPVAHLRGGCPYRRLREASTSEDAANKVS